MKQRGEMEWESGQECFQLNGFEAAPARQRDATQPARKADASRNEGPASRTNVLSMQYAVEVEEPGLLAWSRPMDLARRFRLPIRSSISGACARGSSHPARSLSFPPRVPIQTIIPRRMVCRQHGWRGPGPGRASSAVAAAPVPVVSFLAQICVSARCRSPRNPVRPE